MIYEQKSFYTTFIYGDTDKTKRRGMWKYLIEVAQIREAPWFLSGDFNDIINNDEKQGGPRRPEGSFSDFRSFLAEGDLYDLRHTGDPLSWRGIRNEQVIRCRLDRALSNSQWSELFPNASCEYLRFEASDHKPLLSCFEPEKKKRKGIFRFDRRLKDNQEVKEIIDKTWNADQANAVETRISHVRWAILQWSKEQSKNSKEIIEELKQALEEAMVSPLNNESLIQSLNSKLNQAYKSEEEFWRQRSRLLWLSLGDRNSSYFHAVTRGRWVRNKFAVLEDELGNAKFKEEEIAKVIVNYYQNLFTSQAGNSADTVNAAISTKITEAENKELIKAPSKEEIQLALFSIDADKAPGPDGFSASFFQANWAAIGPAISQEISYFFQSGELPKSINETYVRLIPKVHGPRKVTEYRPIALCSVIYKIIAKLLTRRMKPILSNLISENQSAFVPGRAISDNVLITHEVLHFLKSSTAKKQCSMAVKTDMSKAYDRLEWSFIQLVLQKFGFHAKWIKWIMECIRTVSYSYLVNESPRGRVLPQRGIRQGDPLSPYLFILCSEVLSGLCKNAQRDGNLQGIRVSKNSPKVNHLLFADDTMFFCRTNPKSIEALKKILKEYEEASGQCINKDKSSISFTKKAPQHLKDKVKAELNIQSEGGVGKYLGLPEHFGRRKKDMFTSIVDKIKQKAASWSSKFLSTAGKMVLLKSVLSAMPSYTMSCFKLPLSLCKRIQSALTRFWWDAKPEKKRMAWIAWDKLTNSKRDGGLGFRDIQAFNDALLAKLSWRLLEEPTSLLARVLQGKYCKSSTFMNCEVPNSASHGWRSIITGRDLLAKNIGWALGNGADIKVWYDPWLSTSSKESPMGPVEEKFSSLRVKDLFQSNNTSWNRTLIQSILPQYEEAILRLQPSKRGGADKRIWLNSVSGNYTTKTGYLSTRTETNEVHQVRTGSTINWNREIWAINTSPKLKLFLWKAAKGALPVGERLLSRQIDLDPNCSRCGERESIAHLLFHCDFAQQVWQEAPLSRRVNLHPYSNFQEAWGQIRSIKCLPPTGIEGEKLAPWICWNLWKARNNLIFNEKAYSHTEVLIKAIVDCKEWASSQPEKCRLYRSKQTFGPELCRQAVTCRSDGAWREDTRAAGLGWCFFRNRTEVISEHSKYSQFVSSPLMAEGLAMRAAMETASTLGFKHLVMESDSLQLTTAINSGESLAEIHGVLIDIVSLSLVFESFHVRHISRNLNSVADGLAKYSLLTGANQT